MKHIVLTFKNYRIFIAFLLIFGFGGCIDEVEGTFYLSEKAKTYMIDTTIINFTMTDNVGISEDFFMDQHIWYTQHLYFNEWGSKGKARGQAFGVAYTSTVNNYFVTFVMRADEGFSTLEIEWNQKDQFEYNFLKEKTTSGLNAKVSLLDSFVVEGEVFNNVIEVDYSNIENQIHQSTPVKSYFAAGTGLIRIERKDGIVSNRVE